MLPGKAEKVAKGAAIRQKVARSGGSPERRRVAMALLVTPPCPPAWTNGTLDLVSFGIFLHLGLFAPPNACASAVPESNKLIHRWRLRPCASFVTQLTCCCDTSTCQLDL